MSVETLKRSSRCVRLAGIQIAAQNDRDKNIKRTLSFTQKALEKNAQIIAFPECFTLPWFHNMPIEAYRKLAEPIPGPSTEPFLRLSQEYPSTFFCPVYHNYEGRFFFSTACIQEGQILGIYNKVHLASAEGWNDRSLAEPGKDIPLFKTNQATVGIIMGWDVFFPEVIRSMALREAEIVLAPTAAALGSKFRWLSYGPLTLSVTIYMLSELIDVEQKTIWSFMVRAFVSTLSDHLLMNRHFIRTL